MRVNGDAVQHLCAYKYWPHGHPPARCLYFPKKNRVFAVFVIYRVTCGEKWLKTVLFQGAGGVPIGVCSLEVAYNAHEVVHLPRGFIGHYGTICHYATSWLLRMLRQCTWQSLAACPCMALHGSYSRFWGFWRRCASFTFLHLKLAAARLLKRLLRCVSRRFRRLVHVTVSKIEKPWTASIVISLSHSSS